MDKKLYGEMIRNLEVVQKEIDLSSKLIFLFGHCNATLEVIDELEARSISVAAILDNSDAKQGLRYKSVKVIKPAKILELTENVSEVDSIVLITSRFYASMYQQLRELGYSGPIRKLIDYNTYAEYSLSDETIARMQLRVDYGISRTKELEENYPGYFKVFCPFNALGDIYFMISYFPAFARRRGINSKQTADGKTIFKVVFCVLSRALADVIHMFGDYYVEVYDQRTLDAMIQAALFTQDESSYIAHQDRPYIVTLQNALYGKKIPLEIIYCCGVYGLPKDTKPDVPKIECLKKYNNLNDIPEGQAVIFSPYAKSVTALTPDIWKSAVEYYISHDYKCYTNVIGDEKPLEGTVAISPTLLEMRFVVERAGTFIGIRSGLCDVLREAKAKKIALYPDYNYCDTKWKVIEMYWMDQFDYNLLATEEIKWEIL